MSEKNCMIDLEGGEEKRVDVVRLDGLEMRKGGPSRLRFPVTFGSRRVQGTRRKKQRRETGDTGTQKTKAEGNLHGVGSEKVEAEELIDC